jgi:hypothetical protein
MRGSQLENVALTNQLGPRVYDPQSVAAPRGHYLIRGRDPVLTGVYYPERHDKAITQSAMTKHGRLQRITAVP